MLLAAMNGIASARMTGTKCLAPARDLSEDGRTSESLQVESQALGKPRGEVSSARTSFGNPDTSQGTISSQNLLQGKLDHHQDGMNVHMQSSEARAQGNEVEKTGTTKPSYRGVRQRPWGESCLKSCHQSVLLISVASLALLKFELETL